MVLDSAIDDLVAFTRYLSWADLVRRAYDSEYGRPGFDIEAEPVWGPSFAWLSYWYGSLFVVVEAYREVGWRDRVIDALLAHQKCYADLLRRFRNGVFHFQSDLTDSRILELLQSGDEHVLWVRVLHQEFRRLLRDRITELAEATPMGSDIDAILQRLHGWLPDDPELLEIDRTIARGRVVASQTPGAGLESLHSEIASGVDGMAKIRSVYMANRERMRRDQLKQLGVTVDNEPGG